MKDKINYDVAIAGCGVAGLFTALNLPPDCKILMVCKESLECCDSMLAQGGICVCLDEEDYSLYYKDTMRAGHHENRPESVELMIRKSRDVIHQLVKLGVQFDKNPDGSLHYTKEGAHSKPRICHHKDITGREITKVLQSHVKSLPNVTIMEDTAMTDLIIEQSGCMGITVRTKNGETLQVHARDTVLATGGIGGLFKYSTNFPSLTGDAIKIAKKHEIELAHLDYIQFHPTTLYTEKPGRRFLISESARGEGAILINGKGERFVDELLPRDEVTKAIEAQMEIEKSKFVRLSFAPLGKERILHSFPNIYERCLEEGYDITKEPIPVVPAQHYFMGGIHVDGHSKTSMEHLYAVGETSCNGVHGKNRLASNSLLESLVFAERAAAKITADKDAKGELK